MRLILTVGYNSFLFPKTDNLGAVISCFDSVVVVNSEGYGSTKRWKADANHSEVTFEIVPDDHVGLPDKPDTGIFAALESAGKELTAERTRRYEAERELKALKEKFAAFMPAADAPVAAAVANLATEF